MFGMYTSAGLAATVGLLIIECYAESYFASDHLGVSYEFKLHVDAGREECFYQNVEQNASVYISFQVIRGGDGHAAFSVIGPTGNVLLPYEWQSSSDYEEQQAPMTGTYQLCVDNTLSHFAEKLVSIYFNSFRKENWDHYINEIEKHGLTVSNFTSAIEKLEKNLNDMSKYQEQTKNSNGIDWYLLKGNNSWVLYWSILQCSVIVLATVSQVFFIRSFFTDTRTGSKPRI